MSRFILSLDQGTTSSRAIILNEVGDLIAMTPKEFTQIFPQAGWQEPRPFGNLVFTNFRSNRSNIWAEL